MVTHPTSLFQQLFLISFLHLNAFERNVKGLLLLLTFALCNAITNDVTITQTYPVFLPMSSTYSCQIRGSFAFFTKLFSVVVVVVVAASATNYRSLLLFLQLLSYGLELLPAN
jgi:hypothetical protein